MKCVLTLKNFQISKGFVFWPIRRGSDPTLLWLCCAILSSGLWIFPLLRWIFLHRTALRSTDYPLQPPPLSYPFLFRYAINIHIYEHCRIVAFVVMGRPIRTQPKRNLVPFNISPLVDCSRRNRGCTTNDRIWITGRFSCRRAIRCSRRLSWKHSSPGMPIR